MAAERGATRIFEQRPDAMSFYSDYAQIVATEHEVLLQFYETIPGPPSTDGSITIAKSSLRVTVVVSTAHAGNIGRLLIQRVEAQKSAGSAGPRPDSVS